MSHISNNTYFNQFSAMKGQSTPNGNIFNLGNNNASPAMGISPLFMQPQNGFNNNLSFSEMVNLNKRYPY